MEWPSSHSSSSTESTASAAVELVIIIIMTTKKTNSPIRSRLSVEESPSASHCYSSSSSLCCLSEVSAWLITHCDDSCLVWTQDVHSVTHPLSLCCSAPQGSSYDDSTCRGWLVEARYLIALQLERMLTCYCGSHSTFRLDWRCFELG